MTPRLKSLTYALAATTLAGACASPMAATRLPSEPADAKMQVEFDVFLPVRHEADLDQLLRDQQDKASPMYRHWLSPEEFKERFGADPASVARVADVLQKHGLTVVSNHALGMHVTGTADAVAKSLGFGLMLEHAANGHARLVAQRSAALPAELANEGAMIAAFTQVPLHHIHMKTVGKLDTTQNRYSNAGPYWFTDIRQAYDFPSTKALDGSGRTIAIVMSSDYQDSDMKAYFSHEKAAVPKIVRVPILGGAPFDPNSGASVEVSLDLQQSGGMAPGATLKLYNIPDLSDDSILAAYNSIVQNNAADIVSSSFGGPEAGYFAIYNGGTDYTSILTKMYESVFKQGNAEGITFVASSGDEGGLDIPTPDYFNSPPSQTATFIRGVETPASSPHVTGVGGTNLVTTMSSTTLNSQYVTENAYGDPEVPYDPYGLGANVSGGYWGSGGGKSQIFDKPYYQDLVPTHSDRRTVPDVSLHMGGCPAGISVLPCGTPRSSVVVGFAGAFYLVIGTSVSAPEFAGVLALFEEAAGGQRFGNANPILYTEAAFQAFDPRLQFFHTGQPGFNGAEYTGPVYNEVLGVGTPYVRNMILAPYLPPAGTPQTPSNP